ncbi:hypothetical protein M011DRAFT_438749 [Sporormia fimetaria CBS 119925]|uniref:DNA polymerase delta subunit 3 n=1 Tax=Sporormia fimetaria CBS 119925 TaxID=1340428 RepID=A0A6A6VIS8_9PLEO|nr:hypothetical protein M011DRAFT_438749 [Sporormia fimetaria CBS 119925]
MAEKYEDYLVQRVIVDGKPVTYRLLSRAIAVHVNVAKQMLYDFYLQQNGKKPSSVHATYLLTGRKHLPANGVQAKNEEGRDTKGGSRTVTFSGASQSDMEAESQESAEAEAPVPKTSIVVVREEELESTKSQFEDITSIHVYSLEPGPIQDLRILSVCNDEVAQSHSETDPLEWWRLYGSIHNPYVRKRNTKYAPPPVAATAKAAAPKIASKSEAAGPAKGKEAEKGVKKETEKAAPAKSKFSGDAKEKTLKRTDSNPNVKKDKADFFKAFAKGKAKSNSAASSKDSTPAPIPAVETPAAEDVEMQGMSEDEPDDDEPAIKIDEAKDKEHRAARARRQEQLRKMMEDSDEEMADVAEKGPEPASHAQHAAHATLPPVSTSNTESTAPPTTTTAAPGRRRGKRRVTRTKKVQDEDGYLVTKEEQVWESFSEDEPEPKKPKPAPKPPTQSKGKGGKKGQGNIASFFGKKG